LSRRLLPLLRPKESDWRRKPPLPLLLRPNASVWKKRLLPLLRLNASDRRRKLPPPLLLLLPQLRPNASGSRKKLLQLKLNASD